MIDISPIRNGNLVSANMFITETETQTQSNAGTLLSMSANYLGKVFECEVIQDVQFSGNDYEFHFILHRHGVQIRQTLTEHELIKASLDKAYIRNIFKGFIAQIVNENPDLREYLD